MVNIEHLYIVYIKWLFKNHHLKGSSKEQKGLFSSFLRTIVAPLFLKVIPLCSLCHFIIDSHDMYHGSYSPCEFMTIRGSTAKEAKQTRNSAFKENTRKDSLLDAMEEPRTIDGPIKNCCN